MITRIRQRFFNLHYTYTNPLDAQRAQVLLLVSAALFVVAVVAFIFLSLPDIISTGTIDWGSVLSTVVAIAAAYVSYRFIQVGQLGAAIWIILGAILFGSLRTLLVGTEGFPSVSSSLVVFVSLPIVVAGVLVRNRGLIVTTIITLVVVIAAALAQRNYTTPVTYVPSELAARDITLVVVDIVSVVAVLIAFLGTLQRIAGDLFQLSAQRQNIHKLGLELTIYNDENTLLNVAHARIRQLVGKPFVEIYLQNEEGNLTLAASSGKRRTILSIESNILAEAARSRKTQLASLLDAPERRSHMAASTSFATAVPVMVNNDLIGVIDFQDVVAFKPDEVESLQELADQLALALQRVRSMTGLQVLVSDQERTINRLQNQLQDLNQRQQQNVSEIWSGYIRGRGRQAIGYNLDDSTATPIQATDLPEGLVDTLRSGQLEVSQQGNEQIINVPIRFRDTNLGAMSFAVPADQPLNDRQIEVATTVAERLALALENTRLFEQSQSQATRERKASEVAAALIGATDVRVVLNMAAEQFKEALGAVNTRIYIQPETMMEPLAQSQQEQ
jgi:GAF domain-containing protein